MKTIFVLLTICISFSAAQYSLSVEQIGGAKRAGENNLFRAQLIKNGTTIRTFERTIPFDVPFPAAYINRSTGIVVLSFIMDGFVEVYDAAGTKLWEQNFFKEMGPNYERTITVALGTFSIVFLTSDVTLPNAIVRKYSIDGAQLWETPLPYAMGNEVAMSADEETIIAGSYLFSNSAVNQSTSIIDSKGSFEGSADILFRYAAFSSDERYIAFASNKDVVTVSNETKKEIGRNTVSGDGLITDLLWTGDSLVVQESVLQTSREGSYTYHDPTFILYSTSLTELQREMIAAAPFKTSALRKSGTGITFTSSGETRFLFRNE